MAAGELLKPASTHGDAMAGMARLREALPRVSQGALIDLALLAHGARGLGRLSCDVADIGRIEAACGALGLFTARWERSVQPSKTTQDGGGFVLAARIAQAGEATGRTFLFAGRGPELVELARDCVEDDVQAGLLFGYPSCCIASYRQHLAHHLTRLEPHFAGHGGGPWPYWCNTLADAFGWHLISHFPCSANCQNSHVIARAHWTALVQFDAAFALALRMNMQTIAFTHPRRGIAYGSVTDGRFQLISAAPGWNVESLDGVTGPPDAIRCDFTAGGELGW
jgi:hypothetical protein